MKCSFLSSVLGWDKSAKRKARSAEQDKFGFAPCALRSAKNEVFKAAK